MSFVIMVLIMTMLISIGNGGRVVAGGPNEIIGQCLQEASESYAVNPYVLSAIVEVESGWRPWAISYKEGKVWHARYPTTYDDAVKHIQNLWQRDIPFGTGLGQISAMHLRELQVEDPTILLDPCINLQWASYVLMLKMEKFGNTWLAIERYNGINAAYPGKVQAVLRQYEVW